MKWKCPSSQSLIGAGIPIALFPVILFYGKYVVSIIDYCNNSVVTVVFNIYPFIFLIPLLYLSYLPVALDFNDYEDMEIAYRHVRKILLYSV